MGKDSKVTWTHHTWNPWWGCAKVPGDPACHHCYAEAFSKRTGFSIWGQDKPRRFFGSQHWLEPLRWNEAAAKAGERHRVFCSSMADVFENRRDLDDAQARLCKLIDATPDLDWLLLTKRPENIGMLDTRQRENVWLGTTAATQEWADKRLPELLKHRAAVHFLSAEPLCGPLDVSQYVPTKPGAVDVVCTATHIGAGKCPVCDEGAVRGIDWVIVGGESGASKEKRRVLDLDAVRSIHDQCSDAGVAFFCKQDSAQHPGQRGRIPDEDWVQEFPEVPRV